MLLLKSPRKLISKYKKSKVLKSIYLIAYFSSLLLRVAVKSVLRSFDRLHILATIFLGEWYCYFRNQNLDV